MGMFTRREFLTVVGVAAGGGALAYAPGLSVKAFEAVWGKDWVKVPTGPESWITSLCRQCPGGCGIRVRLIGDRPVKIEGNPLHPVNRGKLCPKGQAGLVSLNDPDRIKGPLKRTGERGSGKWQEITWEEGIKLVTTRLQEIRSKKIPHSVAVMDGYSSGLTGMLFEQFMRQFGSPNHMPMPTELDYGSVDAFYLMQGARDGVVYDMDMANYVVSFDSDLLQSFWSPVQVMKAFGYMRRGRDLRGKFMQVESRYSTTAAKADEWIPVNPGTEGVLALGMANFIIKEGLYDKDFIEKRTFGFEDWKDPSGTEHQGYKNLVLQRYSPSVVSEITGIPLEAILRIAKEFATQGPSLAIGTRGDIYQQMAVHALNGLVGNIDKTGGIITANKQLPLDFPASELDETARTGLQMPPLTGGGKDDFPSGQSTFTRFSEHMLQGKPYEISTLFVHDSNPLFSGRHIEGFVQAWGKIPYIVSFSPYMDETAAQADLILPDHTNLEKWQTDFVHTFQGFPVIGLGKPVAEPRYNTRNTGDVIIEMAKGLGNSQAKAFPWNNSQEAIVAAMGTVYETNQGDLFAPELEEPLLRELVRRGWRAPGYRNFEEFWAGIQQNGGWWNPAYSHEDWTRIFQTPSQKFEFYSQKLKNHWERQGISAGSKEQGLKDMGIEAEGDQLYLPHWEPKINASPDSEQDYPFHLKVFKLLVFAGSLHANNPYLQDIASIRTITKWDSWVEINSNTAKKLEIHKGDFVWIESPRAKLKLRARVTQGAMPDVVSIPMGLGHTASGRWAKGIGEDAGPLLTHATDPLTGEPLMHKTRVKLYKA